MVFPSCFLGHDDVSAVLFQQFADQSGGDQADQSGDQVASSQMLTTQQLPLRPLLLAWCLIPSRAFVHHVAKLLKWDILIFIRPLSPLLPSVPQRPIPSRARVYHVAKLLDHCPAPLG